MVFSTHSSYLQLRGFQECEEEKSKVYRMNVKKKGVIEVILSSTGYLGAKKGHDEEKVLH